MRVGSPKDRLSLWLSVVCVGVSTSLEYEDNKSCFAVLWGSFLKPNKKKEKEKETKPK